MYKHPLLSPNATQSCSTLRLSTTYTVCVIKYPLVKRRGEENWPRLLLITVPLVNFHYQPAYTVSSVKHWQTLMASQYEEGLHILSCAAPKPGHVSKKSLIMDEICLLNESSFALVWWFCALQWLVRDEECSKLLKKTPVNRKVMKMKTWGSRLENETALGDQAVFKRRMNHQLILWGHIRVTVS